MSYVIHSNILIYNILIYSKKKMGFILLLRLGQGNRGGLEREPSITKQCHEICMSTHTSKKKIEHGKSYLQTRGRLHDIEIVFWEGDFIRSDIKDDNNR